MVDWITAAARVIEALFDLIERMPGDLSEQDLVELRERVIRRVESRAKRVDAMIERHRAVLRDEP